MFFIIKKIKMNFGKSSSFFFSRKTLRSFYQSKNSCKFFSRYLNSFSTKKFVRISNIFFAASIQRLMISYGSNSGIQVSKLMIGNDIQIVNTINKSFITILEQMSGSANAYSDFLMMVNSTKKFYKINFIHLLNYQN